MSSLFKYNKNKENSFFLISLVIITLFAAVLRFYRLDSESFWGDEAITAVLVQNDFDALMDELFDTGRPPIMIVLAHFWTELFGQTEMGARSLSAIAGTLSVPLIYLVAARLFDRTVGLVSAFLLAIGYIQIYYSQEYRYYAVLSFFALAASYFYVQALETRKWRDFLLFAVCSGLMIYTHPLSVFILVAWGLHFLLQWRTQRNSFVRWGTSQILILVIILPSFYLQYAHISEDTSESAAALVESVRSIPELRVPLRTVFGFMFGKGTFTGWQVRAEILLVGGLAVAISGFISREPWFISVKALPQIVIRKFRTRAPAIFFLILWLVIPVFLLVVGSFGGIVEYFDRYVIGASLGLYMLLALGIVTLRSVVPIFISLSIVTALAIPSLQQYYNHSQKPQWRETVQYIVDHIRPDDGIRVPVSGKTFYWYYSKADTVPTCYIDSSPEYPYPNNAVFEGWQPTSGIENYSQCGRLWVVMRNASPGAEMERQLEKIYEFLQALIGVGYVQHDEIPFSKVTVYMFERSV